VLDERPLDERERCIAGHVQQRRRNRSSERARRREETVFAPGFGEHRFERRDELGVRHFAPHERLALFRRQVQRTIQNVVGFGPA
jgi:hypothetical protein